VRRACGEFGDDFDAVAQEVAAKDLLAMAPVERFCLASLRRDPLLLGGRWADEAVLRVGEETPLPHAAGVIGDASAAEIRARVRQSGPVALENVNHLQRDWNSRFEFYGTLVQAVARLELDLGWSPPYANDPARLWVRSGDRPALPSGLDWFPPLFFLPFTSHADLLRKGGSGPINQDHPTAQWLIARAPELCRDFPAVFNRICHILDGRGNEARDAISSALDQIARVDPELAAPPEAYLSGSNGQGDLW
jgi:hypothetical protein